ncbi:hypothetical protein CO659_12790 [Rhizobium sp. S9]|uniref:AP2 domain-containing protein n=1 Tax=Rhizobium sp. S9 TaxID=2035454 RepID=UPI000BEA3502|nr:AP2 domain-containing protein [Rhizobium sp. S9]PDS97535.1 hypothetical protein CO659_12790 [Rhizobium sp. S9]
MSKDTDQETGQAHEFYVYTWHRPDKDEIFYVGKGKGSRAGNTHRRNAHFKNIITKLKDMNLEPTVTRVASGLSESDAFKLEIELIAKHKRVSDGGTLCNLTDGGEGSSGAVITDENKAKKSLRMRKLLEDPELREKWSDAQRKRYEDQNQRKMTSAAIAKRYMDPAEREKTSAALRGKPKSNEHVESVRVALTAAWECEDLRNKQRRMRLVRGPSKANQSGYKGVSFDKTKNKWLAQIEIGGKSKHLGRYDNADEAAKAYDAAVISYYGSDVYLNFPEIVADNDNIRPSNVA